jgi:WD40 repeat protein/tRNA A-37 threonylcarbamoyl transferase component Bud32
VRGHGADNRLAELLLRWEELHEQGHLVSPEELCRDCPDLVDELRRRVDALRAIDRVVGLQPASDAPTIADSSQSANTARQDKSLPPRTADIPGYEILHELGRGGMGVVYKARQKSLGRVVALKMILAGAHAGPEQRRRFRREAEAAAHLQHPNIVQVYEVGEHDGCPYLSLEYIDGPGLEDVLASSAPSFAQAAGLIEKLARAAQYAHERGIIHRDLKPANILIAPDGTPKMTNFGLAKRLDDPQTATRTGAVLGTPSYMAPEQAAGRIKSIGPATDIYALGAVLYDLLTGTPPFDGQSGWDTINRVISTDPEPPSRRNARVPRDLETICLKCLEKDPAKRYPSALALADDLHRFQAGKPIAARPIGWFERTQKWVRRRPAVAALIGFSSVLAAALLIGGWVAAIKLYQGREALKALNTASHEALIRLNVANGSHYVEDGDLFASLVWFARALKLDEDRSRQEAHRIRIAAVLRGCPRLSQLCFHEDCVRDIRFSPDGHWLLTAGDDDTARVWNATTGEPRFATPLRHGYFVRCASFSHDGSRIVTASADRTAKIWDAASGREIVTLEGHEAPLRDAQFNADGSRVITASDDKTARVWDSSTGRLIATLLHDDSVVCASFQSDGKQVLTASADGSARIWKLESTGAVLVARLIHQAGLTDACFNPGGNHIATASDDGTARIWNAANGQPVTGPLRHHGAVLHVAFSPDGLRLATAGADLTARIWDAKTGETVVASLAHYSQVTWVGFSPDGARVLTASDDNTARIWDAGNGRPLTPPLRHNGMVCEACFSPDGQRIATASEDTTARIYDLAPTTPRPPPLKHEGPVLQASFSPDGNRIVTCSTDETARIWDAKTSKAIAVLRGHKGPVLAVEFSRDGHRIVTAGEDKTARIWDVDIASTIAVFVGHKGPVRVARFSPNGSCVVTAGDDPVARVWDPSSGALVSELRGHDREVLDAVISPDGQLIATGSADRTARLWERATGKQRQRTIPHKRRVVRVTFSPDGLRLATASFDRTAQLWDVATGEPVLPLALEHAGSVLDVAFSPDGRQVVTASDDNTARVWNPVSGEPLLPPLRHYGNVDVACFSPNRKWVGTASQDNSGRVWEGASGEPLTPMLEHRGWGRVRDIAFSSTSDRVVTACEDGTAQVWELVQNEWPAEDLERLAGLMSGGRIGEDTSSLVPFEPKALRQLWDELRSRHPGDGVLQR